MTVSDYLDDFFIPRHSVPALAFVFRTGLFTNNARTPAKHVRLSSRLFFDFHECHESRGRRVPANYIHYSLSLYSESREWDGRGNRYISGVRRDVRAPLASQECVVKYRSVKGVLACLREIHKYDASLEIYGNFPLCS